MRARSKPVRFPGQIAWPSTISFCGLRKNLVTKQFTAVRCADVGQTYGGFRVRREATDLPRPHPILKVLLLLAFWLAIISLFRPPYQKFNASRCRIDKLPA